MSWKDPMRRQSELHVCGLILVRSYFQLDSKFDFRYLAPLVMVIDQCTWDDKLFSKSNERWVDVRPYRAESTFSILPLACLWWISEFLIRRRRRRYAFALSLRDSSALASISTVPRGPGRSKLAKSQTVCTHQFWRPSSWPYVLVVKSQYPKKPEAPSGPARPGFSSVIVLGQSLDVKSGCYPRFHTEGQVQLFLP